MATRESEAIRKDSEALRKDIEASLMRKDSEGSGSSRSGRESTRPKAVLGSAAASIVGNNPKNIGMAADIGTGTSSSSKAASEQRDAYKKASTMQDFDVGMMNGRDAAADWAASKDRDLKRHQSMPVPGRQGAARDSGSDSGDSDVSRSSHISLKELRKSLKESRKGDIKGDAPSVRLHLDDCIVEAEKEPSAGRWKQSALTDFAKVCSAGTHRDCLVQGLEMYGMKAPNRCQQHLIPVLLYFLGKKLEGASDDNGPPRSMVCIQGKQSGKTTSAVLACLAVIDPSIPQPQAILLSRSSKQAIDKFLRVLGITHRSLSYQAFEKDETGLDLDIDPASPEVVAARTAHVLVGHPGRLRKALCSGAEIPLDAVKVLVVDDAHELFHGSKEVEVDASGAVISAKPSSEMCLSGLPSGDKRAPVTNGSSGAASSEKEASSKEASSFAASAIEDVVEICRILDAAGVVRIPYMVIAEESGDKASKKMMKLLKSSMTSKKNLLSVENCTPPMKLIRGMKHYYAEAASKDWVRLFAGLVQALTFPRALIYCDDERIHEYFREMQAMGIAVSANLPGATADARRVALSEFSSNKTQFLLTHSEPAVCQFQLPKVSCVFHFGIMSQLPSVYGVRLSPLDEKLKKESASILLVEKDPVDTSKGKASKEPKNGDGPSAVAKLQKMFTITFMDMPLEMLPVNLGSVKKK